MSMTRKQLELLLEYIDMATEQRAYQEWDAPNARRLRDALFATVTARKKPVSPVETQQEAAPQ